jgi:hypothetical protein
MHSLPNIESDVVVSSGQQTAVHDEKEKVSSKLLQEAFEQEKIATESSQEEIIARLLRVIENMENELHLAHISNSLSQERQLNLGTRVKTVEHDNVTLKHQLKRACLILEAEEDYSLELEREVSSLKENKVKHSDEISKSASQHSSSSEKSRSQNKKQASKNKSASSGDLKSVSKRSKKHSSSTDVKPGSKRSPKCKQ